MYHIGAGENTGLLTISGSALNFVSSTSFIHIILHIGPLLTAGDLLHQRMLGGEYNIGHSIQRIRSCCEDIDLFTPLYLESNMCTLGTADPVLLQFAGFNWPVQIIQSLQQVICKVSNTEKPLLHLLADHRIFTPLAMPLVDLFVCQYCAAGLTPVNRCFSLIGKAMLIEGQKQPLRPFVVLR